MSTPCPGRTNYIEGGYLRYLQILPVFLLLCSLACDDDCPTCPEPAEANHWTMYMEASGTLIAWDIPADTILDSIGLPGNTTQLSLTSDGQKIVLPLSHDLKTHVFDAATLTEDTALDYWGTFHFDRSRHVGLLVAESELVKIDGITLERISAVTTGPIWHGAIDTSSGIFYTAPYDIYRGNILYRYDYRTMTLLDSTLLYDTTGTGILISHLLPIPSKDRLYLTGSPGMLPSAHVYIFDLAADSLILQHPLGVSRFPRCNLVYDPHRERVYVGDPGQLFQDYDPAPGLFVFDAATDRYLALYPTHVAVPWGAAADAPVKQLCLAPDGKSLYAGTEHDFPVLVFDLDEGLIRDTLYPVLNEELHFSVGGMVIEPDM